MDLGFLSLCFIPLKLQGGQPDRRFMIQGDIWYRNSSGFSVIYGLVDAVPCGTGQCVGDKEQALSTAMGYGTGPCVGDKPAVALARVYSSRTTA